MHMTHAAVHSTHTLRNSALIADIARLHDSIATRVAAALEAGGPTWEVTAPLVREQLGGDWSGAAPVVLARALARAQRGQAAGAARALERGEESAAEALAASLRGSCERLAAVLGGPSVPASR